MLFSRRGWRVFNREVWAGKVIFLIGGVSWCMGLWHLLAVFSPWALQCLLSKHSLPVIYRGGNYCIQDALGHYLVGVHVGLTVAVLLVAWFAA